MKEKFGRILGIVLFTEFLLFCVLVMYIQFQTGTYDFVAWVLICLSLALITVAGYIFGIMPYMRQVCSRIEKMQEILREIDEGFETCAENEVEFENCLKAVKNRLELLKSEKQREGEIFDQYKEMIIRNVKLIYDIAKSKNEKEIEGFAKSLLNIVEASIYSGRIFVPLWYEIMCFQMFLAGYAYPEGSGFEIIVNVQDEDLKQSLILRGILTSLAKLFGDCAERQVPIKNILQISAMNLSGHLSLRLYYNNTIENLNEIENVLNSLKQNLSLYYPEGTYAVNYLSGDNHFVIEISIPIIETSTK
ncbi:hypothetical protein [Caldicellulosiruptor morganii]|uniref:Uncharacterized protein n=1 Tax=Caldicellulosiruptor morganii TaxID=1387555 RepID=A0ABY7BKX2_9FIRM|nr:hypothetical protein [Caldicellulosiruptor morganii]WAM33498.1 hypothetical protein OTK00_002003 [Caldicellulosiruptor morganii]